MKQDTSSSYNNIEELSKVIGFNPNEPYLAPNKIRYKLGKLDRKLANELTKHIVTIRKSISKTIHLKDQEGKYFWYCQTPEIEKYLHKIDTEFRNDLLTFVGKGIEQINKNSLLMDSLTEEAFYSSRIEGAITTHKRAKELVKRELLPQNKSERMMKNNYFAMDFILKHKNEHFDVNMILELHKIVTQSTLDPDDEKYIGKFRDNNNTCIKNISTNEIIYTPPDHKRIKALINDLVNWVTSDEPFVHPVLKASIIHFYLSYVHPFVDGNGRTARSLFYLEMLGSNYNIMRFLSISTVINKHKSLYYKVFKEVEDNESDLTYFLIFSMKVVYEAFKNVENKIAWAVIQFMKDNLHINKRQLRLMKGFCFKRYDELSVEKYIKINNIAYETARKDLNQLVKWNLLNKKKNGKKYYYFMSK